MADHAQKNRLQQVALTISGVHLTMPGLTEETVDPALLQRPLTQWNQLAVKIEPVDFSLSSSDSATWAGSATLVQSSSGEGPRASYLGMLSLLIYELLGGPRHSVEATGRYTPIAVLSEQGNTVLRRGLTDELASAVEMSNLLEDQIFGKRSEHAFTELDRSAGQHPLWNHNAGISASDLCRAAGGRGDSAAVSCRCATAPAAGR